VVDFDGETLRLAHRKGKPPKLRVRHAVLSAAGIELFKKQATEKFPSSVEMVYGDEYADIARPAAPTLCFLEELRDRIAGVSACDPVDSPLAFPAPKLCIYFVNTLR
jgi:hypothetical protein